MRVLILAAGRGSRMTGLTAELPKCLVPFQGAPLLEWQLKSLHAAGIPLDRIAAATGYRSELIESRIPKTFRNADWASTNMIASLLGAEEWFRSDEDVLVAYSDIVYSPACVRAIQAAPRQDGPNVFVDLDWLKVWKARFEDPLSDAERFKFTPDRSAIAEIGGRASTLEEIQAQYMGLVKFSPRAFARFKEHLFTSPTLNWKKTDFTSALNDAIRAGMRVGATPTVGDWFEIDNPTDLAAAEKLYQEGGLKIS